MEKIYFLISVLAARCLSLLPDRVVVRVGAVLHDSLCLGSAAFGVNVLQAGQGGVGRDSSGFQLMAAIGSELH